MLFQRAEKGICSCRLRYVWRGPNVFNVFNLFPLIEYIVCTLHLQLE